MIIDSSDFTQIPDLLTAVLRESADDAGALSLEFAGFGPDWLRYMEPVTIMHRGRVLFHGKITSVPRSNDGGQITTQVSVQNFIWLFDHQTLGAQLAELQAAENNQNAESSNRVRVSQSATQALSSWARLAESCRISAPGWVVNEDGSPAGDSFIGLNTERAHYSFGKFYDREKYITQWTALLAMKQCNPDALYLPDYTGGELRVVSQLNATPCNWDTQREGILSISDIAPQYEAVVTGVALNVSWTTEKGVTRSRTFTYPAGLNRNQMGVKIFTATVEDASRVRRQADYMMQQLRRYYTAANTLQWGGSVTARMEDVEGSPLGQLLSISGEGTHEDWHNMAAVVTETEWDFMSGEVSLTLGRTVQEPELTELTWPEDAEVDEDPGSEGEGGGGGWPDVEEPDSTQEDTTWDDITTTWDGVPTETPPTADTTTTSAATTTTAADTTTAGTSTGHTTTQGTSGTLGSGTDDCGCAAKWQEYATWKSGMDEWSVSMEGWKVETDEWKQKAEERITTLEGYHRGDPTSTGDATTTDDDSCKCKDSITTLQTDLEDIRARLEALEKKECGCKCDVTLADIQAAITAQLSTLALDVQVQGLAEANAHGNLLANSSGGGTPAAISIDTQLSY